MKKLKKLFAVLAFCACLVIPFTACGGYNSGIVESYEISTENEIEVTIKFKDIENLPKNILLITIHSNWIEEYGSLDNYLNNKDIIEQQSFAMSADVYHSLKGEHNPASYEVVNNQIKIKFLSHITKYIFLYDFNDVPDNFALIEEFYQDPSPLNYEILIGKLKMMDLNKYVGFVEIAEAE